MLGFSFAEILFLAVLALVVIGPKQLPEVARMIGRFINEMKRNTSSLTAEFKKEVKIEMPDLKNMAAQRLMDNKIAASSSEVSAQNAAAIATTAQNSAATEASASAASVAQAPIEGTVEHSSRSSRSQNSTEANL